MFRLLRLAVLAAIAIAVAMWISDSQGRPASERHAINQDYVTGGHP